MGRLAWIETLDGWIAGRYQIELAAPQLWVLSRRPNQAPATGLVSSEVVRTGGSLQEMKRIADQMERQRRARRRLRVHLAATLFLTAVAVVGSSLGSIGVFVFGLVGLFITALRTLVIWIDHSTGSPWSLVSDSYQ